MLRKSDQIRDDQREEKRLQENVYTILYEKRNHLNAFEMKQLDC